MKRKKKRSKTGYVMMFLLGVLTAFVLSAVLRSAGIDINGVVVEQLEIIFN